MKKTLIIIISLIALNVTGQIFIGDTAYSPVSFIDTVNHNKTIYERTVYNWGEHNYTEIDEIITLSDLINYQEYCYNDSTAVKVHKTDGGGFCYMTLMGHSTGTPDPNYCTNPEHEYITKYTHKQFKMPEFIKWMEEKK